jgi:hypothetical protein
LPPDARRAMEAILGRPLAEHEAIALNAYRPAPTGAAREEASRPLLQRIDKTTRKVQDVPDAEIEAAIGEALDHVRHHPE